MVDTLRHDIVSKILLRVWGRKEEGGRGEGGGRLHSTYLIFDAPNSSLCSPVQ